MPNLPFMLEYDKIWRLFFTYFVKSIPAALLKIVKDRKNGTVLHFLSMPAPFLPPVREK
ncbi:MAG: hypothetical protein J6T06_12660 [Victivallales bacterium]|nr:hypothetical protein [Victivallales bacterium]